MGMTYGSSRFPRSARIRSSTPEKEGKPDCFMVNSGFRSTQRLPDFGIFCWIGEVL
ncbi:hypothetical protein RvY_15919 [Ramazzottius varieornatus]|uniref:Uncharacterized protein n=1 Tax=Ramazzottius varieornatus TaxID=947166 RepID=A0A1D1VZN7_RAMVA|nr:hypothetical protein RvY_15919 [Ramazzottius varieornatus]